jgi:putative transposase
MKRRRFSEEQIVGVLKEAEAGVPMKDLCRRIGISDATFYHWKAKYGGLEVSETRRLRQLEEENGRLKKARGRSEKRCVSCGNKQGSASDAPVG